MCACDQALKRCHKQNETGSWMNQYTRRSEMSVTKQSGTPKKGTGVAELAKGERPRKLKRNLSLHGFGALISPRNFFVSSIRFACLLICRLNRNRKRDQPEVDGNKNNMAVLLSAAAGRGAGRNKWRYPGLCLLPPSPERCSRGRKELVSAGASRRNHCFSASAD